MKHQSFLYPSYIKRKFFILFRPLFLMPLLPFVSFGNFGIAPLCVLIKWATYVVDKIARVNYYLAHLMCFLPFIPFPSVADSVEVFFLLYQLIAPLSLFHSSLLVQAMAGGSLRSFIQSSEHLSGKNYSISGIIQL